MGSLIGVNDLGSSTYTCLSEGYHEEVVGLQHFHKYEKRTLCIAL
jgi:hypothetical protein